jgi:pilus assembly protein FimV
MMHLARRRLPQGLLLCFLAASSLQAYALGLGPLTVQSGLGSPLQATIPVYGLATDEPSTNCMKARVLTLDGSVLSRPAAALAGSGANASLRINGREGITEPAVSITVEIGCASAVRREYQVLLDPVPVAQLSMPQAPDVKPLGAAQPTPVKAKTAKPAVAAPSPAVAQRKNATAFVASTPPASTNTPKLYTGDAEIEQVRPSLVLRYATSLSEPRVENDPARLAALRADQQRVAALLRGENPVAGVQAQLRDAQLGLRTARQDALEARRQMADERQALEAERQNLFSLRGVSVLAALALVGMAASGWLHWRRRQDRRRHQHALEMLAMPFDTTMQDTNVKAVAEPGGPDRMRPASAAMPPQPQPQPTTITPSAAFDWGTHPHDIPVATTPPHNLDMPESWQLIEQQIDGLRDEPRVPGEMAVQVMVEGPAQSHATQVADMLLAAETWMAEHNPQRAADLLQPYLEREDMLSPAPGLYLLMLYRTLEDDDRIQAVKAQLQPWFPDEVSQWSPGTQGRRSIADFAHIQGMVNTLRDSDALLPYLKGLLLAPEPFDFSAYRDIVRAIGIASETVKTDETSSMTLDFH